MESALYISIIIPVYNRRKLLQRCLDSIAKNTLTQDKYEVIVVDDCSTDGTQEVIKNYKNILNYRYILRETNSGTASVPRNDGIQHARGQYIYFIDSDDYITKQTLEDGLGFALSNKSDIVCLSYFSEGRTIPSSMYKQTVKEVNLEKSTLINNLGSHNKLISRDIIIKNDIRFPSHIKIGEDTLFMIKCYTLAQKISILVGKYYFLSAATGDNLTNLPYPVEDLVHCLIEGCRFIMSSEHDMTKKRNIIALFLNRMLNNNWKKLDSKSVQLLYDTLEAPYGIFSQVYDNLLLTKPYIVSGILKKDVNFIKTVAEYADNKDFCNTVQIKKQKAYIKYTHNNTVEYIDISYFNPNNIYLTEVSYTESTLNIDFYVFDSFFPDTVSEVSLLCMERKTPEKCLHFTASSIAAHKNKYRASIDLLFASLYLKNTIDIYVHTNFQGFSKTTRLGKNKINIENKLNISRTEKDIFINDTQYMITIYETLGGYLAFSIETK